MIQFNIEPFDMLLQHDIRLGLMEKNIKDLQAQHVFDQRTIEQQQRTISQLQRNEVQLSEALGHLLLKSSK
jgi:hypothetical protein